MLRHRSIFLALRIKCGRASSGRHEGLFADVQLNSVLCEEVQPAVVGKGIGENGVDIVHGYYAVGLAATELVVSRAGANAVFEFLALGIPALLVPLPLGASRGDQILNAEYVRKKGYAAVLPQEELTPEVLVDRVNELYASRETYRANMKADPTLDGTQEVMTVIMNAINKKNTH